MLAQIVMCISGCEHPLYGLITGDTYLMDVTSLDINRDGIAYADFYAMDKKTWVGHLTLRHFQSMSIVYNTDEGGEN